MVILRSTQYMSTDSNCAPVNSPDGGTGTFIAEFKASANVTIGGGVGSNQLDYLVVGGGGAGGAGHPSSGAAASGGGAGGYRSSFPGGTKLFLNPGSNAVVIGGGGTGATACATRPSNATPGTDSWVGYITGYGGGKGGSRRWGYPTSVGYNLDGGADGGPGGSGGGGAIYCMPSPATVATAGTGNVPANSSPANPVQGYPGGTYAVPGNGSTGGGGAGAAGGANSPTTSAGAGGVGKENSISGSPVFYGGGGGGGYVAPAGAGAGGNGGGGTGGTPNGGTGSNGSVNTGGGGGGGGRGDCAPAAGNGGNGGTGVVILRAPGPAGPSYTVAPGTNTKAPVGGDTVMTFTLTGTLTIS